MSLASILVLAGIVTAFATFGIVLAWGEYQTRHLHRDGISGPSSASTTNGNDDLKLAA